MTMTDDAVRASVARAEAAKAGPWWAEPTYNGQDMGCAVIAARTDCGPLPGNPTRGQVAFVTAVLNTEARECEATAAFIAAARTDVVALGNEVLRLREALRTALDALIAVRVACKAEPAMQNRDKYLNLGMQVIDAANAARVALPANTQESA